MTGEKRPGPEARRKLREAYMIPEDAWDARPPDAEPAPAAPAEPEPDTALELAKRHVARCAAMRQRAEATGTPADLARALRLEQRAIVELGYLTGERASPPNEAELAKDPKFEAFVTAIVVAVKDCPTCRAVLKKTCEDML